MDYGKEYKCHRNMNPMHTCSRPNTVQRSAPKYEAPNESLRMESEPDFCPCECVTGDMKTRLKGWPLAMVYSPNQDWEELYEPETALCQGTLFSQLYFAWKPDSCGDRKCR